MTAAVRVDQVTIGVHNVTFAHTRTARRVLTATVVTRAWLDTGDKRVTMRVVQDVKELCVA